MNYSYNYIKLIFKAKDRVKSSGMEKHHSVPKHWFYPNKTKKDYDFSVVFLTPREHFLAHRLLVKMFPKCLKAKMSLLRMMNTSSKKEKYCVNNRLYSEAKYKFVEIVKSFRKDFNLDKNRRQICSLSLKNRWKYNRDELMDSIIKCRNDPKDLIRRDKCSLLLKNLNEKFLKNQTKLRNKNLSHMTKDQKENLQKSLREYRLTKIFSRHLFNLKNINKKFIAVLDNNGQNHFISRVEYEEEKGKRYHHVNSKYAKQLRSKRVKKYN